MKYWKKWYKKEAATVLRNRDRVPYRSLDGVYEDMSGKQIGWWTNGFGAAFCGRCIS